MARRRSAVQRSQDDLIAGHQRWLDKQIHLLREYEEAVRRYVRGTGSQADLSKHATAAILGGSSTGRLKQIRDDVQRELLKGDFKGASLGEYRYGDHIKYSVGQKVIESHFGPGVVTMVRGIHVGVQLDDGKYMLATSEDLRPADPRQRMIQGGIAGLASSAAVHQEREVAFARSAANTLVKAELLASQGHCFSALKFYGDAKLEYGAAETHSYSAGNEDWPQTNQFKQFESTFSKKCLRTKRGR